jgi:hypothetical protein
MSRDLKKRGVWLLTALLLLPAAAWPGEFTASMVVKDGDKVMPGKIYVRDGQMRQEFSDESGQTVTVVRPDKKVIWVILPRERTYTELALKPHLPGQFIQMPPNAMHKRLLGKERLQGYETEKYQFAVPGGQELEFQTIWIAPKLGSALKLTSNTRKFSIEYGGIKEGKLSDHLFAVPAGYKKVASPQLDY